MHAEVFERLTLQFHSYKPLLAAIKTEYDIMLSFARFYSFISSLPRFSFSFHCRHLTEHLQQKEAEMRQLQEKYDAAKSIRRAKDRDAAHFIPIDTQVR